MSNTCCICTTPGCTRCGHDHTHDEGAPMTMNLKGPHRAEFQEIALTAIRLAEGLGGPPKYRKAAGGGSALPAYAKPGVGLDLIILETPYTPHTALTITAFLLYGMSFDENFRGLGILPGDLTAAFVTLREEFGHLTPTPSIKEPQSIADALASSTPRHSKLITMALPARPAIAPPERPARPALSGPSRIALPER